MKKLITMLLILAMLIPSAVMADDHDPIVGAWYIMLDYRDYPGTGQTDGKNYMLYIMIFEESGTISGVSAESVQGSGLSASGSTLGTWTNSGGQYTVNLIGIGSNQAEFSEDRLLIQMTENVWYSMQRMNLGSWYSELVIRY